MPVNVKGKQPQQPTDYQDDYDYINYPSHSCTTNTIFKLFVTDNK